MNRYTAAGVTADFVTGKDVVVVTRNATLARAAFAEVEGLVRDRSEWIDRVERSNGREAIYGLTGGVVRFVSAQADGGRALSRLAPVEGRVVVADDRSTAQAPHVLEHVDRCRGELVRP